MDKQALPDPAKGTARPRESLHQYYLAEYEALMTRNTYLMTVQFALWPALGVVLSLLAQLWTPEKPKVDGQILFWLGAVGVLTVGNNWADTLWEVYNNVSYIEHDLRNRVLGDLGNDAFWGYERYLANQRSLKSAPWELVVPILATALLAVLSALAWPANGWQILCLLISVGAVIRVWFRCMEALELREHFTDRLLNRVASTSSRADAQYWIAAILTIELGIVPLALMAYFSKSLWFGSTVDSPLSAVPSVWLGDSIFLPILNYRIIRFFGAVSSGQPNGWTHLIRTIVPCFIIAAAMAGYTHHMWTQDQYLGFIDLELGRLSRAGWWHAAFTTVQMTLVFAFLAQWIAAAWKGSEDTYEYGKVAWKVFLWYSLLSIADFGVLHLCTLPHRLQRDYTWHTAWEGLLVIPFWLAAKLLTCSLYRRARRVPPGTPGVATVVR